MSDFIENLEKSVEDAVKRRQIPGGVSAAATLLLQDRDNPGLSEAEILDTVHEDPIFYAGISLISSKIADTDIKVEASGEVDRAHEVARRLRNPNRFHSKFSFLWIVSAYLLGLGVSYIYRMDDGSLLPVPPTDVEQQDDRSFQVTLTDRTVTARLNEDLVKLTLPDLREPYISGSGYGAALADELDIAAAARDHESSTLHNNARPDMIANFEGISEGDLKQAREKWNRSHEGPNNSGKTAFTNAENLSVESLNTSFADLGFIKLREHSADTIRRTFGIPPELLGKVETSNRATIDAAFLVFARSVLKPKLRMILDALNQKLVPMITDDRDVLLVHGDVVPEDKDRQLEAMGNHPNAFTVNEIRELLDFDAVNGGDVPLSETPESFDQVTEDVRPERSDNSLERDFPVLNGGVSDAEYLDAFHSRLTDPQS